jgi:hypothetical protein
MRDDETLQPGLARLSREIGRREVKCGRGIGLADRELGRPRGGAVHPPDGDGNPRLVDDGRRHRNPHAPRVRVRTVHHLPCRLERDRTDYRFVLAKEGGVDIDGIHVLGGDVDVLEDRIDWADDLALLAVDAHVGIDVELRGARPGMDAGNRAHLDAGSIVRAQPSDHVRHEMRSAALRGDQGQVGTNHVGHVNPGAVLRGHEPPDSIERTKFRRYGESGAVQ